MDRNASDKISPGMVDFLKADLPGDSTTDDIPISEELEQFEQALENLRIEKKPEPASAHSPVLLDLNSSLLPSIPRISRDQFRILKILARGSSRGGEEIRCEIIDVHSSHLSRSTFFGIMQALESQGLVFGWFVDVDVPGGTFLHRWYRITLPGRSVLAETVLIIRRIGLRKLKWSFV